MTTATAQAFWDKIAPRYAQKPIANMDAYHETMARTQSYLSPKDHVLEVGCGTGSTAILLSDHVAAITGMDISPAMIEIAKGRAAEKGDGAPRFTVADAAAPMDHPFNAVLGFNLLHLTPDVPGTLTALAHNLKPGGLLITKTPCLGGKRWLFGPMVGIMRALGKAPRVGFLTARGLDATIEAAGFEIIETGFHPAPMNRFVVARKR